jgi:hypothetical protein
VDVLTKNAQNANENANESGIWLAIWLAVQAVLAETSRQNANEKSPERESYRAKGFFLIRRGACLFPPPVNVGASVMAKAKPNAVAAHRGEDGVDRVYFNAHFIPPDLRVCLLVDGLAISTFGDDQRHYYYELGLLTAWAEKEARHCPKDSQVALLLKALRATGEKLARGHVIWQ